MRSSGHVYPRPPNSEISCRRVYSVVPLGRYSSGQSLFLTVFRSPAFCVFRFVICSSITFEAALQRDGFPAFIPTKHEKRKKQHAVLLMRVLRERLANDTAHRVVVKILDGDWIPLQIDLCRRGGRGAFHNLASCAASSCLTAPVFLKVNTQRYSYGDLRCPPTPSLFPAVAR